MTATTRGSRAPRLKPLLGVAVAVLAFASLWYVEAPPRSATAYREEAVNTTETLRSQVQTARIWLRTLDRDDSTRAAAAIGFREAEEDANKATSSFESYDPPAGADQLRSEVTTLASDVTTALAELRIAAHRGQWDALPGRAAPLPELSKRLDELKKRAQR